MTTSFPVPAQRREDRVAAASVPDPVLDGDARDALVMAPVPGDDRCPLDHCNRPDEEIGVREPLAVPLEERLGLTEDLDRSLVEPEPPIVRRVDSCSAMIA